MATLDEKIRCAIGDDRVAFTVHADNRIAQRGMVRWHLVESFDHGIVLQSFPQSRPHPTIKVRQVLVDGTSVVVVWAYVRSLRLASVVTVYVE